MNSTPIRVYDTGENCLERYTVVYPIWETFGYKTLSALVIHSSGEVSHTGAMPGRHLGKKLLLEDITSGKEDSALLRAIQWDLDLGFDFDKLDKPVMLTYGRKPTPSEIAFGEGAEHIIEVPALLAYRGNGSEVGFAKRLKVNGLYYTRVK